MDDIKVKYQKLSHWLKTAFGKLVLDAEQEGLEPFFQNIFGDYLLILGDLIQARLAKDCRVKQHVVLAPYYYSKNPEVIDSKVQCVCVDYEALPIAENSVDTVLLPHTLELVENPDQVLQQVEVALKPEGNLIIIGFNPLSLCGIRHLFSSSKDVPWGGSFMMISNVRGLLNRLNFEIKSFHYTFYHIPIAHIATCRCLGFLANFIRYFFFLFGGIYLLIAKKHVPGVTPLRLKWKELAPGLSNGVIEPIRKGIHRE